MNRDQRPIRRAAVARAAAVAVAIAASSARAQDRAWRVFGPDQGDHMGYRVARVGDVNGDGFVDVATTIAAAHQTFPDTGAVRMLSGRDGATIWTVDGDSAYDAFGSGLGVVGDLDHDGIPEVVAGALQSNSTGYVKVLSGSTGAVIVAKRRGDGTFDYLGAAADGIGDVDGDGVPDFVAGAPGDDNTATDAGSVRFYSGATGNTLRTVNGPAIYGANFGTSVAGLGDVDGDGFPDLLVGENGAIDVVQGNTGNSIYRLKGDPNNADLFGVAVANLGDLDGDGVADFVVGAPHAYPAGGGRGSAFVYSGSSGTLLMSEDALGSQEYFGTSVGACGDVDGDGVRDFVVGAVPQQHLLSSASIFSGRTSRLLYALWADDYGTAFGVAVGGAGDVDGDGLEDVLVGAGSDFGRQGGEGSVSARLGNDLWLQAVPPIAYTGTAVSLEVRDGPPNGLAGIYLVELNGTPSFSQVTFFVLDSFGEGSIGGTVPPGMIDVDLLFRAYAIGPSGATQMPTQSHDEDLSLR